MQKEAGDDAKKSVVKDEDENERVCQGRKSSNGKGTGEFSSSTKEQRVANNGVEIHENILDHDVDVGALSLDQELIVDSRKDRTKDLDLKSEAAKATTNLSKTGAFLPKEDLSNLLIELLKKYCLESSQMLKPE